MTKYWRQNEVWKCSYCNTEMKKSGENYQEHTICLDNYAEFDGNGQIIRGSLYHYGKYDRSFDIIVVCAICTNANCKNYSVSMKLKQFGEGIIREDKEFFLLPDSSARLFPDYIPKAILSDYNEACLIKNKSPKASATLARRYLQGMIRDFWKVEERNLYLEINKIKDKIPPDLYEAIDAIREIGNIGAHMEKDVNVIIDVDPNEVQMLIELIENLFEEWYIKSFEEQQKRDEDQRRLAKIKTIGIDKAGQKSPRKS
ncbi:DUF4145 domain-containing protein [Commensalibacter intestini]|nr:DUF4145 domain-containing protein [Commensalibacter intestini]